MATAALILAGGQSRRMGRDKALLTLPAGQARQETTVLQRTCAIAEACCDRTYVLTPWPDRYRGLLSARVTYLQEAEGNAGPLVALAQGWSMIVAEAQARRGAVPDWLLVLACDLPCLDQATLQAWQRQLNTTDEDAIAHLPRHHTRWEPLCGFYHRRCLPKLQRAVDNNMHSFQQWLAHEPVVPLSVSDSNMLRNCNTPAQWQQFLTATNARNP